MRLHPVVVFFLLFGIGTGASALVRAPLAAQSAQTASTGASGEDDTLPLRRVLVVNSDTVQLGRPLGPLARYIDYPGDTLVRFPPGTFEGSDAAMAFLDPDGTVRRIGFLFGDQHNIDIMLGRLYRNHGRSPKYASLPIPEGVRETWTWSDRETELAFTRFTPAQSRVSGILLVTNLKR